MHKEKSRLSNDQALAKQQQETMFASPKPAIKEVKQDEYVQKQ